MQRRKFLLSAASGLLLAAGPIHPRAQAMRDESITLFLGGDVMTGRGIDQVLPNAVNPRLYEPYVRDAGKYVAIAEQVNGPIPKPVDFNYVWGDALAAMAQADVRVINLETSVTTSEDYQHGKDIHYRMHPKNVPVLSAAGVDCCALANNHVMDWGSKGLAQTLDALAHAGIKTAGAGRNRVEAQAPAIMEVTGKGRVLVFSMGVESSGIPRQWAAQADRAGVFLLDGLSEAAVRQIANQVLAVKQANDIVVASIHWGGNWGYEVPREQRQFAQQLIDSAAVDIIHGHSSHHVKGIEVYKDKPIIYGCGDFLNDYEGIKGYQYYRSDLALMYFVRMTVGIGKLVNLEMAVQQTKRFRSSRAGADDVLRVQRILNREGKPLATRVEPLADNVLQLRWGQFT